MKKYLLPEDLVETINDLGYYIDFKLVLNRFKDMAEGLKAFNCLIGVNNIEEVFINLIDSEPELLHLIPILIAVREQELKEFYQGRSITYDFSTYNPDEKEKYLHVMRATGLFDLFNSGYLNDVSSYVLGVLAGLDTHGRKNRSGNNMEGIVAQALLEVPEFKVWRQVKLNHVFKEAAKLLPTEAHDRVFDFIVEYKGYYTIIETSYYSVPGSKIKAVESEFIALNEIFKNIEIIEYLWVTDGQGWRSRTTDNIERAGLKMITLKTINEQYFVEIIKNRIDNLVRNK